MRFVVRPDCLLPPAWTALPRGPRTIDHPSGRPFVSGTWEDHEVVSATARGVRIVLLGVFDTDSDALVEHCVRLDSGGSVDALTSSVAGAYHLLVSADGFVRVQGTLSSRCSVVHRTLDRVTVASDNPAALATGNDLSQVSPERLARRLVAPLPPWPLGQAPVWDGVHALPAGHHLGLDRAGHARTARHWTATEAAVPMSEAAPAVAGALRGAVRARLRAHRTISADLSGGLDSTSLCFLMAAEEPGCLTTETGAARRMMTFRWEVADPNNDDRQWAEFATTRLPGALHHVEGGDDAPSWFSRLAEPCDDLEAPHAWIRTRAQDMHKTRLLAEHGATAHVSGDGGDELFHATPTHLHALMRTNPLVALSHARRYRALYRWGRRATVTGLVRSRSFRDALLSTADTLRAPLGVATGRPDFGWGAETRMPGWASDDAVSAVRDAVSDLAGTAPLARSAPQHLLLADAQTAGEVTRQRSRLSERAGLSLHAPFLDDHVIEAALAVRLADTVPVDRYKPALTEAMRGIVPARVLQRRTKHEFSADAYAGLRRNRPALVSLCEDMRLEKLGLVDAAAFRAALTAPHLNAFSIIPLIPTLACENWLRSLPDGG
ncbi:asparagine synthase-related protein [Streptomyces spiramenti]|uniref:asparagine synthase (glutamine-hydrolyzing) n=1 Tax=Streptomyces spiramenti TaxID=2720606 RepID=A0ABX1AFF3_9ACTN|nr:asparagine synthase-related protein [Streptomyces spiramenti]NJP65873.1 asparagine synthase [Streptomyces spiramenti]